MLERESAQRLPTRCVRARSSNRCSSGAHGRLAVARRAPGTAAKRAPRRRVYVHGPSGIGKSALVQHFLDGVERRQDLVVLRGRCYEREAVPYKALDGVIDSLSQYSAQPCRSSAGRSRCCRPTSRHSSGSFPSCCRSGWPRRRRHRGRGERRSHRRCAQRAFDALRELLTRMARQPAARRLHRRPALGRRRQRGSARASCSGRRMRRRC